MAWTYDHTVRARSAHVVSARVGDLVSNLPRPEKSHQQVVHQQERAER